VFCSVQKSSPGFFQTGSGAFPAAPSAHAFDATTHRKKALRHCAQVKQSLISILEITSLNGLLKEGPKGCSVIHQSPQLSGGECGT